MFHDMTTQGRPQGLHTLPMIREQHQKFPGTGVHRRIVHRRVAQHRDLHRSLIAYRAQFLAVTYGIRFSAAIINDDDLVVRVAGGLQQRHQTMLQHGLLIFGGDDDADPGCAR